MKKNYINLKKLNNKINFGFFTSKGGVSRGVYNSLNCSKSSKDKKNNVHKNIKIAVKNLGIEDKKLKLINQIHSNKVFLINKKNYKNKFYGDGLISIDNNIALGVLTADCAPIFIFDNNKKIICSLHSGWKGTLKNIIRESIIKIKRKKINTNEINAIIGPCLGYSNYEVDKKFKIKFIKKNKSYKKFFKQKNKNKDYFNLRGLINFQLKKEGVKNIFNIRRDTYKNSQNYFSHRRTTHEYKVATGRMINIISFRDWFLLNYFLSDIVIISI